MSGLFAYVLVAILTLALVILTGMFWLGENRRQKVEQQKIVLSVWRRDDCATCRYLESQLDTVEKALLTHRAVHQAKAEEPV